MKLGITILAASLAMTLSANAASFSPPPPLDPSQRPVLVYSENEYGKEAINIYAAYKKDNTWQRDLVTSAPFVAIEQLEGPKFLVATGPSAQESELFLTDLEAGTSMQVTTRKGHCPIAFPRPHERYFKWKEAQKAYVLQDADGAKDLEYIEINYADMTFETATFPKSDLGADFSDQTRTKIAPNGEHIAFLEASGTPPKTPRTSEFNLKIFHRREKTVTTAATGIAVQVAESAPVPFGWPAFEWYDWELVIYAQTSPVTKGPNASVTFFTTHIHKDEVTPLLSQDLPLTPEGGEIFRDNPLVKEVVYRPGGTSKDELVIDPDAQVLMAWRDPLALRFEAKDGDVQVSTPTRLLFHAKHFAGQISGFASATKKDFAYALSTPASVEDKERKAELYVNLGDADAEKVVGPIYYCKPIALID